jgi:hypothetical protein
VLSAAGFPAAAPPDGTFHWTSAREVDLARAVKALALADVPVVEARLSADLEQLFRESRTS